MTWLAEKAALLPRVTKALSVMTGSSTDSSRERSFWSWSTFRTSSYEPLVKSSAEEQSYLKSV